MATRVQSISDQELCEAVARTLEHKPETANGILLRVEGGVVTITGQVQSNAAKFDAAEIARHVEGVKAIANEIDVKPSYIRNETALARDVVHALHANICVPADQLQVTVADGRITLDGIVHWEVQKMMAEAAVKRLPGITGVYNRIEVQPQAPVAKLDEEAGLIDTQTDTASFYENLGAVD